MQNNIKNDFDPSAIRRPKAGINEILRDVLALCHREGLLSVDGVVSSDTVFRRFSSEVFRQHKQDVRLREFQMLMSRSNVVLEVINNHKEYRIQLQKIITEQEPSKGKQNVKAPEQNIRNFDMSPLLSSLQDYSLVRDEQYPEPIKIGADINYVITVSRPMNPASLVQGYGCLICRENFRSAMAYLYHIATHGSTLTIQVGETLRRTKSFLKVTFCYKEHQVMSTLEMHNREGSALIINGVYLYHKNFELFPIVLQSVKLEPGKSLEFSIQSRMFVKSRDMYSLLIMYRRSREQCDLLEQHYIRVFEIKKIDSKPIRPGFLGDYLPSKNICTLVANNFQIVSSYTPEQKKLHDTIRNYFHADPRTRLNASNYCSMLELMVHIQDLNIQCDLAQYRADDARIVPTQMPRMYRIDTAQFISLPLNLAEGDIIQLTMPNSNGGAATTVQGTIGQILYDHILVEMEVKLQANCRCQVKLQANRVVCRLELQALAIVRQQELAPLFFPSEVPNLMQQSVEMITSWMNPCMDNTEQQAAVKSILNRVSQPLPYILFGPPGTGKTTTVVEAIVQICTHHPKTHILVTAQSNSACDEVALRLMKFLTPNDLYRFYSRSSEKRLDEIPEKLQYISNLSGGKHSWPTWENVYQTKVLICSLSICGRLVQSKIRNNHFKYVFIDECGSASEPAALVALAGLVSSKGKLNASVVLAGDPYQLGPVVRSELAMKMGLGMSMLERLMKLPVYQKDPETKQYNPQLITKLVRNYRSHEALIKFSNDQFYEGELRCFASEDVTVAENWKWLPNKNFPIILHTVFGSNERSTQSKSLMNQAEIDMVEFYLDFLLKAGINDRTIYQEDIGIISPYQLQVQRLRHMCLKKEWPSVEIGSVEQFQGREKLVIILSTARSHTPDVGFLNNVKRLNVALTRAKALLIIFFFFFFF
ncbi:putative helicase MOV-10 [Ochlerotatus camptorhynchus]|uniref:putative helicase MOV-10 n=1 Tax=Ochlerotatus camptorhynchus TaxID=644619 RepID=UPI0031D4DB56